MVRVKTRERLGPRKLNADPCPENVFVASTYKSILERISQPVMAKATVQKTTKVTSISSSAGHHGDPLVTIDSDQGAQEFDEVVVTVPLGCLKQNQVAFRPAFPARMAQAVANLSYGRLEKVYITFPRAYWHTSDKPFPFFCRFTHPSYAPNNQHHWNFEVASLASVVPTTVAHPTLLFYIYGPCAKHVTNLTTHLSPNSDEYLDQLQAFFRPYYSRLPNFDPDSISCRPTRIFATDWQHDPLAGYGSYVNFQISDSVPPGTPEVQLDKDVEALRHGMPEHGIWLAGEHTAPFVALGTVTGAWWSGEAVAKRIAALHSKESTMNQSTAGPDVTAADVP